MLPFFHGLSIARVLRGALSTEPQPSAKHARPRNAHIFLRFATPTTDTVDANDGGVLWPSSQCRLMDDVRNLCIKKSFVLGRFLPLKFVHVHARLGPRAVLWLQHTSPSGVRPCQEPLFSSSLQRRMSSRSVHGAPCRPMWFSEVICGQWEERMLAKRQKSTVVGQGAWSGWQCSRFRVKMCTLALSERRRNAARARRLLLLETAREARWGTGRQKTISGSY